ncbi:MAG: hypothetical protein PQJ58_20305 [Spirochaetales bacterium]|nr:hypothetical protein [Spirochaetales bacterium]
MKSIKFIALVLLVSLMASCAGTGPGVKEDNVMSVVELLNSGNSAGLAEISSLPFVFDSEILESETQIAQLWTGLAAAGFTIDNPEITQQRAVTEEDASLFSEGWEISTFFKNLLSEKDTFVEVQGASTDAYFILRRSRSALEIIAFKGEVK